MVYKSDIDKLLTLELIEFEDLRETTRLLELQYPNYYFINYPTYCKWIDISGEFWHCEVKYHIMGVKK